MPRLAWTDLANSPGNAFLIVGELAPCFAGGRRDDDPFDSARLRFAANLIVRTCSHLKLQGPFAVQPSREGNSLIIQCVVTEHEDFARLGEVAGGYEIEASLWCGHRHFLLDNATHEALLAVAGQPDGRGAGRRARAASREAEEQRHRWGHD
ncbi:hypothetical protein [Reyranella sp.]|jgi:hypothetical protein|uniref:hypothetical protein n=1 Tax=Reyranella sp. TaxID=1929291 RepID=UPI000BD40A89|nr:hypothetical protein [Reyranella sp.]OYY37246.1 MAG: hypothetical protein B7Y57_23630 [Rhodospirillales bacterium 35-66-84]OYZ94218.1 MAG: hypothetical protein B7Y08_13865 [Rhodospirillales bacterium 24-66-33]OZB23058.1 MAG: hypothetical protein B7X63_21010 [Rhodospirillales bacterium 39-66-50]HQS17236.1 hypothetical protein [Reyranella sp.]HQT13693.1 hypothetical protein [Reyranella sp.]